MAESLRSARDQLATAKEQIERLLSTLARFADHGYPTYWRDRPTDHVVSHVDWPPAYHELRVSDLLRAHAVHESISKELGR